MNWMGSHSTPGRLLSRAQRALKAQEFSTAIDCLEEAVRIDPGYAHLHIFLGMAKSEAGQAQEAETSLRAAEALDPNHPFFQLQLGIFHLDCGDPQSAVSHLRRAQAISPDNALVTGYITLASLDLGDPAATSRVPSHLRDLNNAFRARALVRIEQRRLHAAGPVACVEALLGTDQPQKDGDSLPLIVREWFRLRQLKQARAHFVQCHFENTVAYLMDRPGLMRMSEGAALMQGAQRGALDALTAVLAWLPSNLQAADELETARRDLLARLAPIQHDAGLGADASSTLEHWYSSFGASGCPREAKAEAGRVLLTMARLSVERAEYRRAIELCARAREQDAPREVYPVLGVAQIGVGNMRLAKQALETFLNAHIFPTRVYTRTLPTLA